MAFLRRLFFAAVHLIFTFKKDSLTAFVLRKIFLLIGAVLLKKGRISKVQNFKGRDLSK